MKYDKGLSGKAVGLNGLIIGSVVANDRPVMVAAGDSFLCGDGAGGLVVKNSEGTKTLMNTGDALVMTDATESSSSTTGALTTAGGLGVAKKAFVGTGVFAPKYKNATDASGLEATATTATLKASAATLLGLTGTGIGFYGTTPAAKFTAASTTTGFLSASGSAVLGGSTFTGNTGSIAYTIGDVVKALKLLGLIAS